MKTLLQRNGRSVVLKSFTLFLVALGAFGLSGCEERNADDGVPMNTLDLPTDTLLNLACTDVGINGETCVLEDPENPFMNVAIIEYDVNNPGAENKFELFNQIPAGPTGAKARFYQKVCEAKLATIIAPIRGSHHANGTSHARQGMLSPAGRPW